MDYKSLGENIKKYRLIQHLRQSDLAEYIDCSNAYIGLIERAESKPALKTVVNLANALDVPVDQLLLENYKRPESVLLNEISDVIMSFPLEKRVKVCKFVISTLKELQEFDKYNIRIYISSYFLN